MSQNYIKSSIFGEPITSGAVTQINKRKEVVSKRVERSPDEVLYLTSNAAWIRVTSGVDIDGKPDDSKKYQLFKGIANATNGFTPTETPEKSSYSESIEFGYVPIPGITDFQVNTKGDYGTLRLANISFLVNSPEDFSKLEQLYMRPGFFVLIEWGHSFKVNNDGSFDSTIKYYDLEAFSTQQSQQTIRDRIKELREENDYNYDGMLGTIRNFSWTYNGQNFLCTIDIVSGGELIEGIGNGNTPILDPEDESANNSYNSETFSSDIERILSLIGTTPIESLYSTSNNTNFNSEALNKVKENLNAKVPKYSNSIEKLRILTGVLAGESIGSSPSWTRYIRLRDFLNFLNQGGLLYDADNKNILKFATGEPTTPEDEQGIFPFTTFDSHISLDPGICILPKPGRSSKFNIPFAEQVTDLVTTDLLNIFLNVEYLRTKFVEFSKVDNPSDNTVLNLLKSILSDIEGDLGGINSFSVMYQEDTNEFYIVDTTVTPSKDKFEIGDDGNPKARIDLVGLKSEVENIKVESSLSSEFGTMMAIAATRSEEAAGYENITNMQNWNQGLTNRHQSVVQTGTLVEDEVDVESLITKYDDFLKEMSHSNIFYLTYDSRKFNGYRNIHRIITRDTLRKITIESNTNAPGLIPIRLSFTMKGISGIKILQTFLVNEFFLPERYRGRSAFIIDGLDHAIENGRWVTKISAYFYPI